MDHEDALVEWIAQRLASDEHPTFEALSDHFGGLVIRAALNMTGGNRTRAAKLLGISRPTLISRIDKYGIRIETQAS